MNEYIQESFLGETPLRNYVLLSLQEQPYQDIKSGKKKFEYRTRYQKVPTTAFIYVSQTVKKIVGIIEFDTPIIGNAEEISMIAERVKPGSYDVMMDYLKRDVGYAIPVRKLIEIEPVSLAELKTRFENFAVPQSYYMLNNKRELLDFLLSRQHVNAIEFV